ncbi:UDP-glucose/GDP-mannose dehydrogenase family protein [Kitasatospora sp. RB6PN24]|uniref:UDP-glucose dehydrogenase family protein n=1 Tax=Kitasatospora humi TaxID=2893891 RepID=UPI001E2FCD0C|nr:UDP-glucose/GDP-mannose dehydrogenase family protein [Kitasatospora humi]MCC9305911.1 UDP-glucose/GDP-mannose dehydrogenase family protein [Kitasatospora humi]
MKLTVIGCGYLGATHAVAMAELGHEVMGVDVDRARVHALRAARAPFHEHGFQDLLSRHVATGRLRFTTSFAKAAAHADMHFITVGTPQLDGSDAYDLSHLRAAVGQLASQLDGPALLVGKSTVPVGTSEELLALVRRRVRPGVRVSLAWSPEFLRESHALQDALRPDRMVLGVAPGDRASADRFREVYATVLAAGVPLLVMDLATAELTKCAANAFLATKISFVNAMAELCEATGADVRQLARALAADPRIAPGALAAGLGFGGGCLPKDLRGLADRARTLGAGAIADFLTGVDRINLGRRQRTVDLAAERCGGSVAGRRIGVWGAAFKPGTDDIRDSPALHVAEALHRLGAQVTVHDPEALDNARKACPQLEYVEDPGAVAVDADLLLLLTEWPLYRLQDPVALRERMHTPAVIDARGSLDGTRWRAAGWSYLRLGAPQA